jgi:hypothetical protein
LDINAAVAEGLILNLGDASSGFPFKGTGTDEVTIAGWFYYDRNYWTYAIPWSYHLGTSYTRINNSGMVRTIFDGSSDVGLNSSANISTGTWYFFAAVYSNSADKIYHYCKAAGAASWLFADNVDANIGSLDYSTSNKFSLGCDGDRSGGQFDGKMDAWAIFNGKAFTQSELEGVFDNGWDGNGW